MSYKLNIIKTYKWTVIISENKIMPTNHFLHEIQTKYHKAFG